MGLGVTIGKGDGGGPIMIIRWPVGGRHVSLLGLEGTVIYAFSTDTWVRFKLFGSLGLTLVFAVVQSVYLSRHMKTKEHS